mmetsp:Transcript_42198/g.108682  ORF Transcript_42198/g.108682 Transcript_42198/m.108682 type:complete len:97 (+) Transcript_42198:265-555(+)
MQRNKHRRRGKKEEVKREKRSKSASVTQSKASLEKAGGSEKGNKARKRKKEVRKAKDDYPSPSSTISTASGAGPRAGRMKAAASTGSGNEATSFKV